MSDTNAQGTPRLDRRPEWHALAKHREELADAHLRE
jgi:glucose-6-phosphate isomerase